MTPVIPTAGEMRGCSGRTSAAGDPRIVVADGTNVEDEDVITATTSLGRTEVEIPTVELGCAVVERDVVVDDVLDMIALVEDVDVISEVALEGDC